MGEEIKTSQAAVDSAVQAIRNGVGTLCAFRIKSLYGAIPSRGSAYHDATLTTQVTSGLDAYRFMIEQNASMIQGVHNAITAADASSAQTM